MQKNVPIKNIMSEPIIADITTTPSVIRRMFKDGGIHHMPIVDGTKLIGIISWSDILSLSFEAYGTDERAIEAVLDDQFSVKTIMQNENLTTALESDTVRNVADKLATGKIHSVPIVDNDNNLKGIVTSTDIIKYLLSQYG